MFSLKKWNAVAMWSWDVECDTCAICRVQVMGKHCTRGPGRATAFAGLAPDRGTSQHSERLLPEGEGAGIALPQSRGTRGHAGAVDREVAQQTYSAWDWSLGREKGSKQSN